MTSKRAELDKAVAHMHEPWGGMHCLDFANTLEPRGGPPPLDLPEGFTFRDELTSYVDLVAWSLHKEVFARERAEILLELAGNQKIEASRILIRAHALRDAIYRACWSIANRESPKVDDLETIKLEYGDATEHAVLLAHDTNVRWGWQEEDVSLARPLWSVARSAIDLLTAGDPARIKVCPGPGRPPVSCGWLFYDISKNGSRRWCSMSDCGSVTKANRQTARRRADRKHPS